MEAIGLPHDVEFEDTLTSPHRVAASIAGVAEAVSTQDPLRVFSRQDASIESLANPVDQWEITDSHRCRAR